MDSGFFTDIFFHPDFFDTGSIVEGKSQKEEYIPRDQILREDEEILAIIIAIGSEL